MKTQNGTFVPWINEAKPHEPITENDIEQV
jgi:hypothetical protein